MLPGSGILLGVAQTNGGSLQKLAICSAVSFVLAGTVNDCSTVCASALLLSEAISRIQVTGLFCSARFILIWSLIPADFEDGTLEGFARVLRGKQSKKAEALGDSNKDDYGAVPELSHNNQSANLQQQQQQECFQNPKQKKRGQHVLSAPGASAH